MSIKRYIANFRANIAQSKEDIMAIFGGGRGDQMTRTIIMADDYGGHSFDGGLRDPVIAVMRFGSP